MKKTTVLFYLLAITGMLQAQQTSQFTDPQLAFRQAKDYFQKEQYSLAYPLFKDLDLMQRAPDRSNHAINYQEIKYYTIVCGLKQDEKGAVAKAQRFIDLEDNEARGEMMSFHLAEYYFRQQDYPRAIELYEKVNSDNLSNTEIADKKFHQGYAYFTVERFDEARPLLDAIRQMKDDPHYADANYYYGFICFYQKKYGQALEAFRVVEDHPEYGKVAPYYISVIYFMQGDQQKAIEYAERKLKRGNLFYEKEMQQLVGHGYFTTGQYAKALPYLEKYVAASDKVSREDMYELSYCYYKAGNWNKAIDGFKQLSGKEDSLAQNSMYLLGDAYLKTGQKANARNAFLFCSANSSNQAQKEVSMYNYAKLSYELGYQDVALDQLQKFLQTYPASSYHDEAIELLVAVLANTNNYKDALSLIDSLQSPTAATRKIYPRILFGRASELINDGMLLTAADLLSRAEADPNNKQVLPLIYFWQGEIDYRLNKTDEAIRDFFDYLKAPLTNGEANPANARYNLGYCYLRKENFQQALGFFNQVAGSPSLNAPSMQQDAYLRSADCYYMNRDYKRARSMYEKVIGYSWPQSDYASFQVAMIAGIQNNREKIRLLSSLAHSYPESGLLPDANMEMAGSYLANEQYQEAIPYLKNVISSNNQSLKPRAYLRLGLAYYNIRNNSEALNQFTQLLQKFPNSPEADEALESAESIYVAEGRSAEYVNFARSLGKQISASQEDQLAYQEAEVQFNNGDFPAAAKKFEDYLTRFPDGKYSLEAQYYKSEIYYNQKDWARAAPGYEAVADKAPNKFGEKSLLFAARLNFFDLKNYEKAEQYFAKLKSFASTQENKLEAMRGLLRSQFQLEKWSDAVENARELLDQKGIGTDDKVLANMAIARAAQENNQCDDAITSYRQVAALNKSSFGAEARYQIAHCLFEQKRYKDAEKAAFEVINKSGSYEEWVTRAYLLLGDLYFEQKDYFNAKATFQSIVDNAHIESLRKEAEDKLEKVKEAEKNSSKVGGE